MGKKDIIKQIQKDFGFLKPKVKSGEIHSVLLYGSYASNEQTARSDVDICIVAPKLKTSRQQASFLRLIWRHINVNKYDTRVFESFPLYMKMSVIDNNKIIFSRNIPELSYYFYFFRKLWNDQSVNWIER